MNKKQVRILMKIALKATLLLVIIGGIIAYFYTSVYLTQKNKEILKNPKVQEVIKENRKLKNSLDLIISKGLYEFKLPNNLRIKGTNIEDRFKKQMTTTQVMSSNLIVEPLEKKDAKVSIKYEKGIGYISDKELDAFTKIELDELGKTFYELYEYHEKYPDGVHILEEYPLEVIKINGRSCLRGSFVSQEGKEPQVFTQIYTFYGKKNTLEIKMDFKIEEEFEWGPSFLKLIQSFKFFE